MSFMVYDPRRTTPEGTALEMNEGLDCYDDGYWDGRDGGVQLDLSLPEAACDHPAFDTFAGVTFDRNPDGIIGDEFADLGFQLAGSNTGAGLDFAADMLGYVQPSRAEPTVILVTTTPPTCGPGLGDGVSDLCQADYDAELVDALDSLEKLGAVTHVLAISTDEQALSRLEGLTTGRGQFFSAETAGGLADGFDAVARDIKLQVVQ
jgi:hypothetical protein